VRKEKEEKGKDKLCKVYYMVWYYIYDLYYRKVKRKKAGKMPLMKL